MSAKLALVGLVAAAVGITQASALASESISAEKFADFAEEKDVKLGSSCKTVTEQVGPCAVEFKVCGGFYKRKFRYTATACASGKCGSSGHTKSAKGAAEEAAKALFAQGPACAIPPQVQGAEAVAAPPALQADEEIPMLGGITCKKVTEQVGPCSVQFEVCGGISKLKWKYHAKACASGICRSGGKHSSAKGAAEDAAKQLFAVPPACALPPQ